MLTPDELREAIQAAEKAAVGCTRFCRVVGEYSDDSRYRMSHNGTGATTTDSQVIHASPVLGLGKEALAIKLTTWIDGLHQGKGVDLNATMATGEPAVTGWGWPHAPAPSSLCRAARLPNVKRAWTTQDVDGTTWRWTDGTAP